MFSGALTHSAIRWLDRLAHSVLPPSSAPAHQVTGRRGEEDAYFFLRKHKYVFVARNYRSPLRRGEIDLIAWHRNVLCFLEVKTRTTHDVKPAQAAVDYNKQKDLTSVAREFLRHLPGDCQWRFDVVTVYYEHQSGKPHFELFQNAFPVS
jgi:putative endonuclease